MRHVPANEALLDIFREGGYCMQLKLCTSDCACQWLRAFRVLFEALHGLTMMLCAGYRCCAG